LNARDLSSSAAGNAASSAPSLKLLSLVKTKGLDAIA
jgi:hypothetical protein